MDNITKKDIIEAGIKFYENADDLRATRYKSWDHCHKAFTEAKEKKEKGEQFNTDYLCLLLSTYLASWGMYRNSFLLWCDYKIHTEVIENVILKNDYFHLWNIEIDKYDNKKIELLKQLRDEIEEYYKEKRNKVSEYKKDLLNKPEKEENQNKPLSDTLISKILLGTLACVPAYDRYFILAIKKANIIKGPIKLDSIEKLINNEIVKEILKDMPKEYSDNYPQMKLLDSCFWQLGYDIENRSEEKANKNK